MLVYLLAKIMFFLQICNGYDDFFTFRYFLATVYVELCAYTEKSLGICFSCLIGCNSCINKKQEGAFSQKLLLY